MALLRLPPTTGPSGIQRIPQRTAYTEGVFAGIWARGRTQQKMLTRYPGPGSGARLTLGAGLCPSEMHRPTSSTLYPYSAYPPGPHRPPLTPRGATSHRWANHAVTVVNVHRLSAPHTDTCAHYPTSLAQHSSPLTLSLSSHTLFSAHRHMRALSDVSDARFFTHTLQNETPLPRVSARAP